MANKSLECANKIFDAMSRHKIDYVLLRGFNEIFIQAEFNDIDIMLCDGESLQRFLCAIKSVDLLVEVSATYSNYQYKLSVNDGAIDIEVDIFLELCWRGINFYTPKTKQLRNKVWQLSEQEQNIIIILKEMLHNSRIKNWGDFSTYIPTHLENNYDNYVKLLQKKFSRELSIDIINASISSDDILICNVSNRLRKTLLVCTLKSLNLKVLGRVISYYLGALKRKGSKWQKI